MEFKPLAFRQVSRHEVSGPLVNARYGYNYSRSELVGLHIAKGALVITMRFTPTAEGREAPQAKWTVPQGEVEFGLFQRDGWYLGGIRSQAPGNFCWWSGSQATAGDGQHRLRAVGAKPNAYAPRHYVPFSIRRTGAPYGIDPDCDFALLLRPALFGGWSEVIVEPAWSDHVWVARP
jgi:hypothetical protein